MFKFTFKFMFKFKFRFMFAIPQKRKREEMLLILNNTPTISNSRLNIPAVRNLCLDSCNQT